MSMRFLRLLNNEWALPVLRLPGFQRFRAWRMAKRGGSFGVHKPESSLLRECLFQFGAPKTYIDCGCGDSADALVVRDLGATTIGIDLYPPRPEVLLEYGKSQFVRADICEEWPIDTVVDLITAAAVVPLMSTKRERMSFFKQAHKHLTDGGILAFSLFNLQLGHLKKEEFGLVAEEATSLFTCLYRSPHVFIFQKTVCKQ